MKMMGKRNFALALMVCSLVATTASSATPERDANNLLINKLRKIQMNLAPADSARLSVTLRLADLLAERARQDSNEEIGRGCNPCTAGREDRIKAIELYQEAVPKLTGEMLDRVQFQLGYLQSTSGKTSEALATYQKVIARNATKKWITESQLATADIHYQARKYAVARPFYDAVSKDQEHPQAGYAFYRKAWCDFQEGKLASAISLLEEILETPALMKRSADSGLAATDSQFQEEVSRDLAGFLAKSEFRKEKAEKLFNLSPANAKLENVTYLAKELERMGQPVKAIEVWNWILQKQNEPRARLAGQIQLTELYRSQNLETETVESMKVTLVTFRNLNCSPKACVDQHYRIKKMLTEWYNARKAAATPQLVEAFNQYNENFPEDVDLTLAGSFSARQLKAYDTAMKFVVNTLKVKPQLKADQIEKLLLTQIELAELMKNVGEQERVYRDYLATLPNGSKAFEVQYQIAKLAYDKGANQEAAQAFKTVALSKNAKTANDKNLQLQAAHLSLDALAILKDETNIAAWAKEYASLFSQEKSKFENIELKTKLNQSAAVLNKDQSKQQAVTALAMLKGISVASASEQDQIGYYKNVLIAAERAQDLPSVDAAATKLLSFKSLSAEDRQFAMSRQAWVAEMTLDFKRAFDSTKAVLGAKKASDKDQIIKLGLLAELAQQDSRPFYVQLAGMSTDPKEKAAIEAKLIKLSKNQQLELEKSKNLIEQQPEAAALVQFEIFAANNDLNAVKKFLKNEKVKKTPAGTILTRHVLLDDVAKLKAVIEKDVFKANNQREMAKSIKMRADRLTQVEGLLKTSDELQDWLIQVLALDMYEKLSSKFHDEVVSLPMPEGLTPEQQTEYLTQLSQMVGPYKQKATQAKAKLDELWSQKTIVEAWLKSLEDRPVLQRNVSKKELIAAQTLVPTNWSAAFQATATKLDQEPKMVASTKEVEDLRQAVRANPLDQAKIKTLYDLEVKLGNTAMATYLNQRLQSQKETK